MDSKSIVERRVGSSPTTGTKQLEYDMSVWRVAPVEDQPEVVLTGWAVYEVVSERWPEPTIHFVGRCVKPWEGRVSSAISTFDATTMKGITASGRVYQLRGEPGFDSDAWYTFNAWCSINKITEFKEVDITAEA